jgi:hypothetical protein
LKGNIKENKDLHSKSHIHFLEDLENIFQKMNINDKAVQLEFLDKFLQDKHSEETLKLRVLYFKLQADLEKMENLKDRIDTRAYKRTRMFLFFLWLVLVIQTAIFFYGIYFVDHLGWDLMEPLTYLFQSIVLLLGVMAFTKLHRNYMSGTKLVEDTVLKISIRNYAKNNFNMKIYNELKKESRLIKKHLKI